MMCIDRIKQKNKLLFNDWLKGNEDYKLCLILENVAYFTNIPLEEQTGDDWDDSPYDCNAGRPYSRSDDQIIEIMFDSHYEESPSGFHRDWVSVDFVNSGKLPWIRSACWRNVKFEIFAGASIKEFVEKLRQADIDVYIKMSEVFDGLSQRKDLP